ncbi:MAG: substrate-binding domain-containing protein [Rhodospirillaceae bacterium]
MIGTKTALGKTTVLQGAGLVCVGVLLAFAGGVNAASANDLSYVGSSTVGKFITDAKDAYSGAGLKLDTRPESSGGESCPLRDACDFGGVARDVKPEFLERGVEATLIGQDAIAAIVNAGNPVKELSKEQIAGIFTGKITDWSEVGGSAGPIKPMIVKQGSATRNVFQSKLLDGADYAGAEVVTPDAKIVAQVARDPAAIGQISLAFIQGNDAVVALTIDGQAAEMSNTSYFVTRPLYLTTKGAPSGAAKDFIDWAVSAEGQAVVQKRFIGIE